MTPAIRSRIDQMIEDKPTVDCCNHSEQIRGGLYTPARRCAHVRFETTVTERRA